MDQEARTSQINKNKDNHRHSNQWQKIRDSDKGDEDNDLVKCKTVVAEAEIPSYKTVTAKVDIQTVIIRDLLLAVYDCRGDLKSFNNYFEDRGSGNSQNKRRELRKKLKDDHMKGELQWESGQQHSWKERRGDT